MSDRWARETIINFNEEDEECDIYTHSIRWINRLESLGFKPYSLNGDAKSYKIPKKMIKLPSAHKRVMTDEQRKVASERFKKMHSDKRQPINNIDKTGNTPLGDTSG